jgi:hypothetical protein
VSLLAQHPLDHLEGLHVRAEGAAAGEWQEQQALRLENGLVLLPGFQAADASIEVSISTEGPAYPGVAFRVADVVNYELAYAVPHVSGQWDALQYDPVFHGSNTWQVYHGPAYQASAEVPIGRWFQLRVDVCGSQATISVDDQPPLVVERLAHGWRGGYVGLWTYLPAWFRDLRVSTCQDLIVPAGVAPASSGGLVGEWFAEGYGVVTCEPNGVLNLNRYLPASLGEVHLVRAFELPTGGEVTLEFGFSDALTLEMDGETIWAGENTFRGFADRAARGYAEPGENVLQRTLAAGTHRLSALLRVTEGFGWGLALQALCEGLRWLPAELG